MIGTTLAHYRITAALGAGGMGEVWRAQDTKLGRDVALKVLSEEFADDAERLERFEREARAVATLNHPHIVTIFSVEEAEGVRFLTMELIEGRSLDKLIPDGGLDLATFLELATPLAEAISAAHDKSVIHRDLKPTNVMVDGENRVKVLDFGLAKMHGSEGVSDTSEMPTEALTGIGTLVGTVPYMSPEQIEGKIVDHRTDVFSLGVLLYEMATGERPFQGESSAGLMSSILRDAPAPVGDCRDDLPNHLGRIISRCLEKDRRDRYQTTRDVFNELKALLREFPATGHSRPPVVPSVRSAPRAGASSSEIRRGDVPWIAVLPFGCPTGDADIEAFADGLEEDIATGLSRFSYLFVVARKSTRRFRGEAVDVRQVGEELGARYVMEAGIRRAGSRIRIGMNLIDSETGTHMWSETYDRDLDAAEVFELQDEITGKTVATVADGYGILVHSIEAGLQAKTESEYTSWEWLIRLFGYRQRPTPAEHASLRNSLEEAVDRDPNVADVWACLSQIYLDEHGFGFNVRPDAPNRALTAAQRAVDIDRASQLGYQVLAQSQFFRRDLKAFRSAADRAMSLNPRDSNSIGILGLLIVLSGEFERGADIARRAMELNPNHAGWYHFGPIWESFHNRDYEKALEHAKQVNMPGMFGQHLVVAAACGHLGRYAEAEAAINDLLAHDPDLASSIGQNIEHWHFASGLVEPLMEGLEKAGLKVAPGDDAPESAVARTGARKTVGIAVLPFTDMSPDKDQDYFCEGMAEEIMNALVQVEGIRVASRTSAFRARQEGHGLAEIARLLSVGHVLEGSVRTSGSRLRVTAQLTDVASGHQLWSERFDRELEDIFAVQDEIAAGVVKAIEARLAPGARTNLARPQARNLEAYRSYLLGQHLRYAKEDHGGAVLAFQEAIRLDPTHAPSWTGLAESLALSAHMSLIPAREACAAAREALSTALELQGESADGFHGEAFVAFIERRWKDLEAAVRRAIELQPSHVPSLGLLGMCLSLRQKPDEAEPFFERARQADPLASFPYMLTALGLLTARRPQEAHRYAEQALTFEKEDASALFCSSLANVALGHFEEGIAAAEHGVAVSHRGADFLGLLGWALATAGRKDEARTLLAELRARPAAAPPIVSEGWLLGALGEIDAAFEVLVRAEDEHQLWLYYIGLPAFDPLRSDPRFGNMVERLGLPPSPVASQEAPPSSRVDSSSVIHETRSQRIFVGRGEERAALDRMLDEAAVGRGGLVLLAGEPGVGKTRLATEILEDGRERGMLALAGHAYEDETAPFVTSSEILEEMVQLLPADDLWRMLGDNASELARLLPELRTIYSDIPEPADVPPELLQRHLFKNVLEFLTRGSAEQPMVMLFDDIHWADESSLLLLEHIAPRLAKLPILMIGTYRDVEADIGKPFARSMTTLVRQRLAERITVRPFDEGSVADVLTALGGSAPPASLAHAIHEATEGNVFFIEETFLHLSEEDLLFDGGGAWRTDIDVEHLDVPEGVRLVTARRLERLSEPTRTVLSLASVIGLRFAVSVLEAAAPDAGAVLDALEEAEAAQLLKPAAGDRDLRYEFVHALARQTLLSELSPLRQQRMHLTIADAIERTSGSEPERRAADIAHHLVGAGSSADPERVVRWLMAAGENAVAATAMEEAVETFDKALSIAGSANQDLRAQLLRLRGPARLGLGDSEGFQADLFEAFTIYESRQRGEVAAETASELAYILIWTAESDRAHEVVTRALDLIGETESRERCRLLSAQGLAHSMGREPGDPGAAKSCHEAAVEMARQVGDPRLLAEALQNQAMGFWHRLEGGGRHPAHEAASIQREAKREWSLGNCLWLEKASFTLGGLFEKAAAIDEELRPLAERNANFGALGIMELMNSTIRRAKGDLEGSSQALRRSREHFEAGGFPWGSFQDGYEAVNLLLRGKNEEARLALDNLGANLMEGAVYTGVDTAYWLSGKAHLGDSDILEQYRNYHSYVPELGRAMTAGALVFLKGSIEALVLAGERNEAAKLYPLIADFVENNLGLFDFAFGLHERFAGMAAAAGRDWEAADRHFKKALELAENLPHRVDQARVRYWYARMLLGRGGPGDDERALEMLTAARELSEEMGLHGLIQLIDAVSGDSGRASTKTDEAGASEPPSIAVLPFVDMSPARDHEWFCEGVAEEIINALTRLPGLRVIARTSSFRFRGEQDLRKVGEALRVDTLLEGSVRKAGQRLRITAQLIDVADDSHIWSERFDRELVDVFAIQDEISAAIVEKLQVSLGASEPARRQTDNVAAYEALLEGRHHFSQFTPESTERALVCFRRALTLDPEYPDALAFSAFYHLTMAYMFDNPREMLPNTRELGERALQVDPHHGEAQAAVAVVSVVLDHDWSAGELLFQQALEAAPASARVHELYGLCWLLGMGRFDEALAELDLAIKLDPLSALYAGNRGRVLTCSRRFAEAQESCRRGLALDSRQLLVQVELTYALLFDGKLEEAIAIGERAIETHGPVNAPCQALALSYALAGRRDEAFDLVKKTARPDAGYRSPLALGLVHAAFSEMDAALACVEQSFEERDPLLMYLAVHPMFDTLRSDPRYPDLLQRMNLDEGGQP